MVLIYIMDYFNGKLENDCQLLYHLLQPELARTKSGTTRRKMFEKGHEKKELKGSYSCTIGTTSRVYLSPTKNRNKSKIYSNLYETKLMTEKPDLFGYIKDFMNIHKDFEFTDIQINFNWQSPPHFDKGNTGKSLIIGLGNYKGGELVIEKEEEKEIVDIRHKPFIFDGQKYKHWTQDFTGNRMSIVLYTPKNGILIK